MEHLFKTNKNSPKIKDKTLEWKRGLNIETKGVDIVKENIIVILIKLYKALNSITSKEKRERNNPIIRSR